MSSACPNQTKTCPLSCVSATTLWATTIWSYTWLSVKSNPVDSFIHHLSVNLYILLSSLHLSIPPPLPYYPSTHLYIFIHSTIYYLSLYPSVHPYIRLSHHLAIPPSINITPILPIYLSSEPSIPLAIHPDPYPIVYPSLSMPA